MLDNELDDLRCLLQLVMDSCPFGIGLIDLDFRLRFTNTVQAARNGYAADATVGKRISEIGPSLAASATPKIQFVLDTGLPLLKQELVGKHPTYEGEFVHRLVSYYPWRGKDGSMKGVMTMVQDAKDDPFGQQLLEESQQRLLNVLDNLFAFVAVLDLDGTLIESNRAPLEAAGLHLSDVRGRKIWDTHWWSHDATERERLKNAVESCQRGEVVRYDAQIRMRDESRMWIDFMIAPLKDQQGRITHLIQSATDISLRHTGQLALEQSEELYRSIVESSDDAIITKSLDSIITAWNPAATRLWGYSAAEAIGQSVIMLFPQSRLSEEPELMAKLRKGERVPSFETVRLHKNGSLIDVAVTISPLRDRTGTVVGACKLARDITIEKRQRDVIRLALEEKTALLHEVHHRVKNNLQIVASLLNLQSRKASPAVALALGECQGRVQAMALVHQLLYESENMAEVNLGEYLKRLLALTQSTFDAPTYPVEVAFSGPERLVTLDNQRTVPCGLVVNELVLNAFKHAFSGEYPGRIDVALKLTPEDLIELTVADNGRGLPEGFSWGSKKGLGTQLIPLFVNQLKGKMLTESSSSGARFTIQLAPGRLEVSDAG